MSLHHQSEPVDDPDPDGYAAEALEELPLSAEEEIRQLLDEDQSRLGDVYRLHTVQGRSAQEVADLLNVETPGFVYTYRAYIEGILHGTVSSSPHLRRQTAASLRSLIKRNRSALSQDALRTLTNHLAVAEQAVDESDADVMAAPTNSDEISDLSSLEGRSGIYAFSYGWYLEHPVDEDRNTTLIKVGRSADVGSRIREHRRGARAHIPEPLVVVRVYSVEASALDVVERQFHRLLATAGHDNPRRVVAQRSEVGKEWFLTNEAFLDAIASVLGLRTEYIGRSEFSESPTS